MRPGYRVNSQTNGRAIHLNSTNYVCTTYKVYILTDEHKRTSYSSEKKNSYHNLCMCGGGSTGNSGSLRVCLKEYSPPAHG